MDTPINEKTLQHIQEEIRKRVFEAYAQKQGVKTQWTEIEATIEALHEVTQLPMEEIQKIAEQVTNDMSTHNSHIPEAPTLQNTTFAPQKHVDELDHQLQRQRRKFIPHLISFVFTNIILITLNIITTSFPWAMFPFFGWLIGLSIHFMQQVYYPSRDLDHKREILKSETHNILSENIAEYPSQQAKMFNGTYRILLSDCSFNEMKNFIQNLDITINSETAYQTSMQLMKLREKVLPIDEYNQQHSNPHPHSLK